MNKIEKYNTAIKLKSQGLSCSYIAEKVNMSRKTVYEWCTGKRDPNKLKGINNYKVTDKEFVKIVKESFSIADCLRKQGVKTEGGNYKGFYIRVERLELDISHFTGQAHLKNKTHDWASEIPVEEAFVENGNMSSGGLKRKILKYKLKDYICERCKITEWQEETLSLHLDHKNGDNSDNRLENLRFLCPNCHSLTPTYCGKSKNNYTGFKKQIKTCNSECESSRNKKSNKCVKDKKTRGARKQNLCIDCLVSISPGGERCRRCAGFLQVTKIDWPPHAELEKLVNNSSMVKVGKMLGVSDNAVRKRLKNH